MSFMTQLDSLNYVLYLAKRRSFRFMIPTLHAGTSSRNLVPSFYLSAVLLFRSEVGYFPFRQAEPTDNYLLAQLAPRGFDDSGRGRGPEGEA